MEDLTSYPDVNTQDTNGSKSPMFSFLKQRPSLQ
jgi:hypothetical protein